MKAFRRKRRPGNRNKTKAEAARICEAKELLCIPCLVWAELGHMPREHVATCCDYNHIKSGNIRVGHDVGYAGCGWHHRGIVGDNWTRDGMRAYFGPSLTDGSKLYQDTYGTHEELKRRQDELLGEAA